MKSNAKITMNSLKTYSKAVQQIFEYSSAATEAISDFEKLIASIDDEIKSLEEKRGQLNAAEPIVDNKIVEYEIKIKETQLFILEKENKLASIRAEMAITPKYTTYTDSNGNTHLRANSHYISLERQAVSVKRELSSAKSKLNDLEEHLGRCRSVKKELNSVSFAIESRVATLSNSKMTVNKNRSEYYSTVASIRNHSSNAASKLSMIEKTLDNYMEVRLNVVPAFETVNSEVGSRNLSDIEYMNPQFRSAEAGKRYDDTGKLYKNSDGLVPNSTFKLNNYTFTTDGLGRPVGASGKLRLAEEKKDRIWDSTLSEMGKGDEKEGDNRGHIIGHQFDGPDSMINAFPQDEGINKGEYKAFETNLASELRLGKEVFVAISPIYSGASRRPTGVAVSYTIDGVRRMRYFNNDNKDGE